MKQTKKMEKICYVPATAPSSVKEGGFIVGMVKEGQKGYYPIGWRFKTFETASNFCDERNKIFELNEVEAAKIVATSMRQ